MRFLLILVACLAAAYSGYWFVGRGAANAAITGGLERIEAEGLDVAYTSLETVGFPSRFDTTITDLSVADPGRGLAWDVPFFQVFAVSTQPNHVIAVWPDSQRVTLPGERLLITSGDLRASLRASPSPSLPLREATLEGRTLALAADAGWEVDVAATLMALRAVSGEAVPANSYEVFAEATDITLPRQILEALGGVEAVPAIAERLRIDGRIALDQPLDRFAAETGPVLTSLTLRDLTFRWGDVTIAGEGSFTVDSTGRPEGRITLEVTNWQRLIDMAQAAGLMTEGQALSVGRAAAAMANGAGQLTAPINFQNGFTALGPLPIGPAPRLR